MIELDRVSRQFGSVMAVDDVSMRIRSGTITSIVGTSGSGKSTLLRMINRLIEPSSGTIRLDGQDTSRISGEALRLGIGYVIQGHGLFPHWTVARNVATVPNLLKWDKARINQRVIELLRLLKLDPDIYASKYPHQLSGGQQQRVGVARALAAEPSHLLMDEPFGALDPVIRTQAQDDLASLQKRLGLTIVIVTHDMEEAIRLSHDIAVMDGGRLLQMAPPIELLTNPAPGFVEKLIDTGERPFRLLSLARVQDIVSPGQAAGPPIRETTSLRDALGTMLWSRQQALPVETKDGRLMGQVSLASILDHAAAGPTRQIGSRA